MHDVGDIVVEHRAQAKEFRFLLRSWYNTTRVDSGAQNPNLRRHDLKSSIVPRPEPLQSQSQDREKEAVHTVSFRSAKPARGRENTWYATTPIIPNPLDFVPKPLYVIAGYPEARRAAACYLGIADETLILFTTDNGTESQTITKHEKGELLREKNVSSFHGEQIVGGKGQLTDWGIRVPTIARWPGTVPAGRSNDDLVDFTDFLPTFNELAGLSAPSFEIDGRSFAALLTGGNHEPREWIFSQRNKNDYCLRTKRWKLCHNGRLYDTREDPSEKNPIHPEQDTPESAEARKRLTK